eukprot:CAMPEP_0178909412 /NCGR_PEP_ID=MMETSP0786-20121207/8499_1 /TAXON_ID=186022 /ORGANISM="Thalassionema frauenfeldii, Strain CCMP 1798" /LENGTH=210 /DNA_ID=CAMNT_0020581493 /DNA_START=355 /DNA_END=987 /DNA_ORIENTATION=-
MQTLLPGVIGNNNRNSIDSMEGIIVDDTGATGVTILSSNAMTVLKAMCKMAITLGLLDACMGTCLLGIFPGWFVKDAVVAQRIAGTSVLIGCVLLVHAVSMMLEGLLFAVGDAPMVARFYLLNAVLVQFLFGHVRRAGPTLPRVWGAFLAYQVVRASEFGLRLVWNQSMVTKKRQLWSKILDYVQTSHKQNAKELSSDGIVWSSSYDYQI